MFDHEVVDQRLKHGHFDHLPFAGSLSVKQSRQYRRQHVERTGFVGNNCRHIAWFFTFRDHGLQISQTTGGLNHVVICRSIAHRPIAAKAVSFREDQVRVGRHEFFFFKPQLGSDGGAHVVHEDICRAD